MELRSFNLDGEAAANAVGVHSQRQSPYLGYLHEDRESGYPGAYGPIIKTLGELACCVGLRMPIVRSSEISRYASSIV